MTLGPDSSIMNANSGKENSMNMHETSRLILGLRAAGWDNDKITDFILWVETGDDKYKPKDLDK